MEYLKKDKMLNKLIELFSKYNISGRYFELDFVSNDNIFKKMNNQCDDSIEINPLIRLNGIIHKSLIDENPALKKIESECDLKEPWL